MSWFEDWFNSPLYEKLYAYRNEEEAKKLAALIEQEIPQKKFPNILDLGCGRGRHSITLAKLGYRVTGVDLSPEAIKKARATARKEQLSNVTFKVDDMRNSLNRSFDAVLNLFTTFGYFLSDDENINVLQNVHSMLENDGIFIMDYLNAEVVKKTIVPDDSGSYGKLKYDIERKIEDGMVFKTIHFSGKELQKPIEYQERVKLYDLDWFKETFSNIGLQLKTVYGNYEGADFSPEKSPRLIMVSQK